MNTASSFARPERRWSKPYVWGLALLALAALAIVSRFGREWIRNPDLSHGLATPFVFAILIQQARRSPPRYLSSTSGWLIVAALFGALALALLGLAGMYAAALEWSHTLVEFFLGCALVALFVAAWIVCARDSVRWIPWNWPAFAAVGSWLLSTPIPPGTYTRLTLTLQDHVTAGVLFALQWLGIPATRDGNVIDLAHVSVGVEEACSGVRSLISCIFAALFISAVICRRPGARAALLVAAPLLAVAMNFVRSLVLTLLAYNGIEIQGFWHDATGYGILAFTAIGLAVAAIVLERLGRRKSGSEAQPADAIEKSDRPPASPLGGYIIAVTSAAALGLLILFGIKTAPSSRIHGTPPDLADLLPKDFSGWEVTTRADLHRFSAQLQTDSLLERTYVRTTAQGEEQITLYVAYWPAGQTSVSLVASHTPDACWPGSGWVEDPLAHRTQPLNLGTTELPAAEFRAFHFGEFPQRVWYWHLFGDRVIHPGAIGSPRALLLLAWRYGFRKEEPQMFVRLSSNRPWEEIQREPLVAEMFKRLHSVGL